MTTLDESIPSKIAQSQFTEQQLPFPPLPEVLAGKLQPFGESVYSSRDLEFGPYTMAPFVIELRQGEQVDNYAVLGFDGHGLNSWAAHYFNVDDALALFIQLQWGGAYTDEVKARTNIENAMETAKALQGAMKRAVAQGKVKSGVRLVVANSDFGNSGWGWVEIGNSESEWHESEDVFSEVTTELTALFQDS